MSLADAQNTAEGQSKVDQSQPEIDGNFKLNVKLN